ncbi:beta-galactosidase [Glycomyces harbinensis]|uniref:Glycosyl hydrolases family 35 n=1 Tax=Glycomyces harbinensis TaxID=58114 RepID=A0A1G6ZYI1_9ACTN|nr:beta-galactosidase [Glycomyces harbinensis]SDE07718.1 Glycosyl hydrolases family 35 [Glycomyces harbinensis]
MNDPNPAPRELRATAPPGPRRGHLPLGEPEGAPDRIDVNARWIERAGRPWFPTTGEIHYSRIPRNRWNDVLGHARAGGLDSIATYVFWRAHEPEPGRFDWSGDLDLRAFVRLAAEHGLDVVVRLGPWAHGEARHGGFPDWLVARDLKARTDDPDYLALVRPLYAAAVAQLRGLTHAEGGPVIAAQVDNELYDQPGHLATLRALAEELGLRVPIWTATGWGGAQVPDTLLPVYGAYAEGFWEDADVEWPAFAPIHFRYSEVRDDLSVGADLREALDGVAAANPEDATAAPATPFATCELGGGMHVAYHRRPLVTGEDVAALALAKIGSGSAWQGYYMYAGGTQRSGSQGPEQESHESGYPNDVPALTYDFNAPIGEHGQIRPHHHFLRRQHLWLREDGHRIAAMGVQIGGGGEDPEELRWSVRSDGRSGYLFLTTYQPPKRPLASQPGVQFTVHFDDGPVTVPSEPVDVPAGHSLVWPLRYPLTPDLTLRSATAQLLTRLDDLVVFAATDGIPAELVLGDGTPVHLPSPPGPNCIADLPGVRLLVLDEASANRLYQLDLAGRERLVLADAPVHADRGDLVVHPETARVTVAVLPAPPAFVAEGADLEPPRDESPWRTWTLTAHDTGPVPLSAELKPGGPAPEPRRGGPMDRLSAPDDYSSAAEIRIDVPDFGGADRALLRLAWTGDTGRAYAGDRLIGDHFWHGRVWDVDLTPHRDAVAEHGVRLELLPWRRETGVWVDPAVRDVADGTTLDAATLVRVGRVRLHAEEDPS